MAEKGMDVEQVRNFANNCKGSIVDQIHALQNKLTNDVHALDWQGPDSAQFKGDRLGQVTQAFTALISRLQDLGQVALNNASGQESTSNAL